MLKKLGQYLMIPGLAAVCAFAQTQLSIKTGEPAWVQVDGLRRGMTSGALPLKVDVTPGPHKVTVEALVGINREEVEVEAKAEATTYVQIKLSNGGLPSSGRSSPAVAPTPPGASAESESPLRELERRQKERQLELDRQQREAKIRAMEAEISGLERQKAAAETMKDQAERARQDCNSRDAGLLGGLKATNCMLGELNYNKAQQRIRELQVEISSKQREVQRLDSENRAH